MLHTAIASFLKTRWVLLLVLLALIVFKIPHLHFPFYCDEGWVYAPAVKTMAINGPTLLPATIPSEFSRGHPLLFHFLCSLWIRCFGASNVALHTFPLLVSLLFIIVLYEGCYKLFGNKVAILSLLLLVSQVIFFVQSAMVEPEIMVALLTFASLYFYAKDRLLLTSVMLLLLFFTKESGLVFGVIIGCDALIMLFRNKEPRLRSLQRLAAVVTPALLLGVFFMIQKAREGWYLLPFHSGLIHLSWDPFYAMLRICLRCTFKGDVAVYYVELFIMLLAIPAAIAKKNIKYLFLCLPCAIIYMLNNEDVTSKIGDGLLIALFILFFLVTFYCFFLLSKTMDKAARKFILLMGCCFAAYLIFSSIGVVTYRYMMVEIMFVMLFLACCINLFIDAFGKSLYYVATAGILAIGSYGYYYDGGNDDTDLEAFHVMKVQQNVVTFLEKEDAYNKRITGGCFWEIQHLMYPQQGFLSSSRAFGQTSYDTANATTDYAIFDNVCGSETYAHMQQNPNFHLVYKTSDGKTWAEIYKRN